MSEEALVVEIRRARASEHTAIGELTLAAYQEFLVFPVDGYADELRSAAARDREAELWVAVDDDGSLLGTVTTCPEGSPWRELAGPGEGEFRMLAVHPAARGRGVGMALTEHCVALYREQGARAVVLSSLPDMVAAHRIYERLGFRRAPDLDWHPVPEVLLIAYRLELEAPGGATWRRP